MITRYSFLILSAFVILTTTSCKRQRMHKKEVVKIDSTKIETAKVEIITATPKVEVPILAKIDVKPAEIDFKYLNIKSKVDFSGGGQKQAFPVNIHIKKDSIIWLSITMIVEGARAIITKDSVIFLDRLNRNYYKFDFVSLSKRFNYPINFDLVQSILIGNMPIKKREIDEVLKQDGGFIIKQKERFVSVENFISDTSLKLQKLNASDSTGSSKMQIDYANFLTINDLLIPQEIKTQINALKDGKISQTLINFQFSIPKTYLPK